MKTIEVAQENVETSSPSTSNQHAVDLIQIPPEMQIYIYGTLSNRYLKEIVYAFEEVNHNQLTKTLEMLMSCCFGNQAFSANLIHQILNHINNCSTNEIKQVLSLLQNIILIEDNLQLKRLRLVIDGYKDNEIIQTGLLNIIKQNQTSDAKKAYHCIKFIIATANK
jgi:ubiquitin carboxyl-terminal hydrolase 9/24